MYLPLKFRDEWGGEPAELGEAAAFLENPGKSIEKQGSVRGSILQFWFGLRGVLPQGETSQIAARAAELCLYTAWCVVPLPEQAPQHLLCLPQPRLTSGGPRSPCLHSAACAQLNSAHLRVD